METLTELNQFGEVEDIFTDAPENLIDIFVDAEEEIPAQPQEDLSQGVPSSDLLSETVQIQFPVLEPENQLISTIESQEEEEEIEDDQQDWRLYNLPIDLRRDIAIGRGSPEPDFWW